MNDQNLIQTFERDLKNKIQQKMLPNLTEEQTLVKFFKYFDLDNSGVCSIREWMKAIEKLGINIVKTSDLQKLFKHYDVEDKGSISYKEFANQMFSTKKKSSGLNAKKEFRVKNDEILRKFHNFLKGKGGRFLVSLLKEFKLADYNNSNSLNIDEFIRIVTENKISLAINEIQILFHSYDIKNSGNFYYEELFKDLKNLYNSEERNNFLSQIFNDLKNKFQRELKISDLKQINKSDSLEKSKKKGDNQPENDYLDIVDSFKFIKSLVKNDMVLTKDDFIDLMIYYGFGIDSESEFKNLITSLFTVKINQTSVTKDEYNNTLNTELLEIVTKLKKSLIKIGKRSFLSFSKHFKFYEINQTYINKYDFTKVLKDFRLNLTVNEIEKLFDFYSEKSLLNYEKFLNGLSNKLEESTIDLLETIYKKFLNLSQSITIEFMKFYRSFEENDKTLSEFVESWDIFHFTLKHQKSKNIQKDEFIEFYQYLSFMYENKETLENEIKWEWGKILGKNQNEIKTNEKILDEKNDKNRKNSEKNFQFATTNPNKSNQVESIKSNYELKTPNIKLSKPTQSAMNTLKDLLRKRGVRGLMNLHKQFLLTCSNLKEITFKDFNSVIDLQKLKLSESQKQEIFNKNTDFTKKIDFFSFLKIFKSQLNGSRLEVVEQAFLELDNEQKGEISVDELKLRFNAENHPLVLTGLRTDDDIIMEFFDTFELNYGFIYGNSEIGTIITFQEFANYYEYVSFAYENDNEFFNVVSSNWKN